MSHTSFKIFSGSRVWQQRHFALILLLMSVAISASLSCNSQPPSSGVSETSPLMTPTCCVTETLFSSPITEVGGDSGSVPETLGGYSENEVVEEATPGQDRGIDLLDPQAELQIAEVEAISAYERGDYDTAIKTFTQAISIANLPQFHNDRGNAYLELRMWDKALVDYNQALELDPGFAYAYYNRGRLFVAQGDFDDAVSDFQTAQDLSSDEDLLYPIIANLAEAYYFAGMYEKALQTIEGAIDDFPNKASAYRIKGDTLMALEDPNAAINAYQQALQVEGRYAKAHIGLGKAFLQTGSYESAIDSFYEACQSDPLSPEARLLLGVAYLAVGESDKAETSYEEGLSLHSDTEQTISTELVDEIVGFLNSIDKALPGRQSMVTDFVNKIKEVQ